MISVLRAITIPIMYVSSMSDPAVIVTDSGSVTVVYRVGAVLTFSWPFCLGAVLAGGLLDL